MQARLLELYPLSTVTILGMTTRGDQILDRTLSKVGGKGLFVKELEVAMQNGEADLAVHSLKDVPMELPEGFELAAVLEREDPRDAFVSNTYRSLEDLPAGAVVGTSSLRRQALIASRFPLLTIQPLRGNLDTRLGKLDRGEYAAIILAAAGVKRLGMADRISSFIEPDKYRWLPLLPLNTTKCACAPWSPRPTGYVLHVQRLMVTRLCQKHWARKLP